MLAVKHFWLSDWPLRPAKAKFQEPTRRPVLVIPARAAVVLELSSSAAGVVVDRRRVEDELLFVGLI